VSEIVVCSPPDRATGLPSPVVLAAAELAGIEGSADGRVTLADPPEFEPGRARAAPAAAPFWSGEERFPDLYGIPAAASVAEPGTSADAPGAGTAAPDPALGGPPAPPAGPAGEDTTESPPEPRRAAGAAAPRPAASSGTRSTTCSSTRRRG
jgi:hypothetical protein